MFSDVLWLIACSPGPRGGVLQGNFALHYTATSGAVAWDALAAALDTGGTGAGRLQLPEDPSNALAAIQSECAALGLTSPTAAAAPEALQAPELPALALPACLSGADPFAACLACSPQRAARSMQMFVAMLNRWACVPDNCIQIRHTPDGSVWPALPRL